MNDQVNETVHRISPSLRKADANQGVERLPRGMHRTSQEHR